MSRKSPAVGGQQDFWGPCPVLLLQLLIARGWSPPVQHWVPLLVLLRHKPSPLPGGDSSLHLDLLCAEGRERTGGTFRMGCKALQPDSCREFCVGLLLCVSLSENSLCVVLVKWHRVDVPLEVLPL